MEILSPTLVTLSVRLAIAGINQQDWPLFLLEVKQAYIHEGRDLEVYPEVPDDCGEKNDTIA